MKQWEDWFAEKYNKKPEIADYMYAMREGDTNVYRDAAARAFARFFVTDEGSLVPGAGNHIADRDLRNNQEYNPYNAFFLEWEDKVDKFHLDNHPVYQKWLKEWGPEREKFKAELLYRKRVMSIQNAYKDHPNAVERMKQLANKWERYEKRGLLNRAVNLSMASKFMDELRKDPTLEKFLPAELVDNPGTELSAPLYNEIRNFIKNEKEDFEGFFAIEGDFRRSAANKLRTDSERDLMLRNNPQKIQAYSQALKEQRAKLEEARRKTLGENQVQKTKEPPKTAEKQEAKDLVR